MEEAISNKNSPEFGLYLREQYLLSKSFSDLQRRVKLNRDTILRLFLLHGIEYRPTKKSFIGKKSDPNTKASFVALTRSIYLKPYISRKKDYYFFVFQMVEKRGKDKRVKIIRDKKIDELNRSMRINSKNGLNLNKELCYSQAKELLFNLRKKFNILGYKRTPPQLEEHRRIRKEKLLTKLKLIFEGQKFCGTKELKRMLYEASLKEKGCECCHIKKWKKKEINFHLDHINGDHFDNRLENLRILCPNCHSQTDTYTGKNIGKKKIK